MQRQRRVHIYSTSKMCVQFYALVPQYVCYPTAWPCVEYTTLPSCVCLTVCIGMRERASVRACVGVGWGCGCACFASSTISAQTESHSGAALIKRRSDGAIELPSQTLTQLEGNAAPIHLPRQQRPTSSTVGLVRKTSTSSSQDGKLGELTRRRCYKMILFEDYSEILPATLFTIVQIGALVYVDTDLLLVWFSRLHIDDGVNS